jgi:hypothetical protein
MCDETHRNNIKCGRPGELPERWPEASKTSRKWKQTEDGHEIESDAAAGRGAERKNREAIHVVLGTTSKLLFGFPSGFPTATIDAAASIRLCSQFVSFAPSFPMDFRGRSSFKAVQAGEVRTGDRPVC